MLNWDFKNITYFNLNVSIPQAHKLSNLINFNVYEQQCDPLYNLIYLLISGMTGTLSLSRMLH
jgi:hypothetical protein